MAHPFQKHREHGVSHDRVKKILKAEGGAIDEDIDVRSKEEMPTSVGPYGLGRVMQYERSVQDRKETEEGKRFYDTGTRVPGVQKAKNDAYSERLKKRK